MFFHHPHPLIRISPPNISMCFDVGPEPRHCRRDRTSCPPPRPWDLRGSPPARALHPAATRRTSWRFPGRHLAGGAGWEKRVRSVGSNMYIVGYIISIIYHHISINPMINLFQSANLPCMELLLVNDPGSRKPLRARPFLEHNSWLMSPPKKWHVRTV